MGTSVSPCRQQSLPARPFYTRARHESPSAAPTRTRAPRGPAERGWQLGGARNLDTLESKTRKPNARADTPSPDTATASITARGRRSARRHRHRRRRAFPLLRHLEVLGELRYPLVAVIRPGLQSVSLGLSSRAYTRPRQSST